MSDLARQADPLLADIRQLIDAARRRAAVAVNAELTMLYWQIGQRIRTELLQGQRAEYGKQVIKTLSPHLTRVYGKGWSEQQLWYCVQVAERFPGASILHTLCGELTWSHLRLLLPIDDPLKRDFYIEIARLERWSVRQLQERITIDQRDYKIDLLFFHRRLRALVAIDLKVGEFEAGYKGQMELYLRYLEKYEQLDGETPPIGLILCTGKNEEHVELMRLDQSNIRVADYLTLLPPPETLRAKLHQSIEIARQRLASTEQE
jgi:hypothetical protein